MNEPFYSPIVKSKKKSKIVDKMRIIQHDEQLYIANFHEKE